MSENLLDENSADLGEEKHLRDIVPVTRLERLSRRTFKKKKVFKECVSERRSCQERMGGIISVVSQTAKAVPLPFNTLSTLTKRVTILQFRELLPSFVACQHFPNNWRVLYHETLGVLKVKILLR